MVSAGKMAIGAAQYLGPVHTDEDGRLSVDIMLAGGVLETSNPNDLMSLSLAARHAAEDLVRARQAMAMAVARKLNGETSAPTG